MKYLQLAGVLPLVAALGACSVSPVTQAPSRDLVSNVNVSMSADSSQDTVLLVSLDDGSVIKQTIRSSADLCFKMSSDSATTCLTQGAPIYDPVTNAVIGFQMIEDHIELVAKSD